MVHQMLVRITPRSQEIISGFRDDIRDAEQHDSDDGDEEGEQESDDMDLWTRGRNWLFFVPIGLAFFFLKRRCRQGSNDSG